MSMIPKEIPYVRYAQPAPHVINASGSNADESVLYFTPRTPPGTPPPETSSPSYVMVPRSPSGSPPDSPPGSPPKYNQYEANKVVPKSSINKERKVELPKYQSRRAELLQANKPVYNYYPRILSEYTINDYLRHVASFTKASPEDKKSAQPGGHKERQACLLRLNAAALKEQIQPIHLIERWFLVVDTKILLEDMFFIEKLVKSDKTCRLHMPYEVLHDLTAMSRKGLRSWVRIPARRLVQFHPRLVKLGRGQGAIEAEDVLDSPVAFDSVINCCLQLMRRYYYVVLVTDDPARKIRANHINLPCYDLKQTKELTIKDSITVTIQNGVKNASLP